MNERYKNLVTFVLSENLLTIAVLGSIFTFHFISAFKMYLIDPLMDYILPQDIFGFLNVKLRDGIEFPQEQKKLTIEFGSFFKALITYIFLIGLIFVLSKYFRFLPDSKCGNVHGAAIM